MRNKKKFILIPIGIVAMVGVVGIVVMQLWNHLLPDILHVGTITYWQAVGLFALCKILFGFGGRGGGGGKFGAPWMRGRMEERFKNMSPEDREKFKAEWGDRCGWGRNHHFGGRHGKFGHDFFGAEKEAGNDTSPKTEA